MSDWAEEDATRYSSYVECALDPQGAADTVKGVHEEVVRLRAAVARVEAACNADEINAMDTQHALEQVRDALRDQS